jgi:hypothetical protein
MMHGFIRCQFQSYGAVWCSMLSAGAKLSRGRGARGVGTSLVSNAGVTKTDDHSNGTGAAIDKTGEWEEAR